MNIIKPLVVASAVLLTTLTGCNESQSINTAWATDSAPGGAVGTSSVAGNSYSRSASYTVNQSTAQTTEYSDAVDERDQYRTVHEYHFGGGYYY